MAVKNDIDLATNLVMGPFFTPEGMNELFQVVQQAGQDLPGAIAHILYTHFDQAKQVIQKNDLNISNNSWAPKGGVIDRVIVQVLALLATKLGDQFANPRLSGAVRDALMQILHDSETASGGRGDPALAGQGQSPQGDSEGPDDQTSGPEEDAEMPPQGPPQQPGLVAPGGM